MTHEPFTHNFSQAHQQQLAAMAVSSRIHTRMLAFAQVHQWQFAAASSPTDAAVPVPQGQLSNGTRVRVPLRAAVCKYVPNFAARIEKSVGVLRRVLNALQACTRACTHSCTHLQTHARMHACTHARTRACTHAHWQRCVKRTCPTDAAVPVP